MEVSQLPNYHLVMHYALYAQIQTSWTVRGLQRCSLDELLMAAGANWDVMLTANCHLQAYTEPHHSKSDSDPVVDSWHFIFLIWLNPLLRVLTWCRYRHATDCRWLCSLIPYKVMQCKTCHNNLTLLVLRIVRHCFQHLPLIFGHPKWPFNYILQFRMMVVEQLFQLLRTPILELLLSVSGLATRSQIPTFLGISFVHQIIPSYNTKKHEKVTQFHFYDDNCVLGSS